MDLQRTDRSGIIVCRLEGKFDIEQTERFENFINEIIAEKPQHLGLDLNGVEYIDSSAIGSVIKLLNLVKNHGGEMLLFGMKPLILNVFKLAKLDNFFKILSNEEMKKKFPDAG